MRSVSVYRRLDVYYVQASSKATTGIWVASGDIDVLPTSTLDSELGAAVARRLEHSFVGVPHPTDFKALTTPILKAANVRSYTAFARSAELVSITERDGPVTITPTKRDSPRGGYTSMPDRAVTVASTEIERLGSVVRELLAESA